MVQSDTRRIQKRLKDQVGEQHSDIRAVRNQLNHEHDRQMCRGIRRGTWTHMLHPNGRIRPRRGRSRHTDPSSRSPNRIPDRRSNATCRPGWWSSVPRFVAPGCAWRRTRPHFEPSRGSAHNRRRSRGVPRRRKSSSVALPHSAPDPSHPLARERSCRPVRSVHGRKARPLLRGQEEARVLHGERRRDPCREELVERHPRSALDDAAQDVRVIAVDIRFAGLGDCRQRCQTLHRRAHRLVLVGRVPAVPRRRTQPLRLIQRRNGDVRSGTSSPTYG